LNNVNALTLEAFFRRRKHRPGLYKPNRWPPSSARVDSPNVRRLGVAAEWRNLIAGHFDLCNHCPWYSAPEGMKMISSGTFARLLASAMLLTTVAACGGDKKPAETTTTTTETAPTAAPAADVPAAPVAAAAPAAAVTLASLKGDAVKGEQIFAQCKTCHVAEKGVNRVGPSLWGVVGRHSGSAEGFKYSPANKNSGLTWTEDELFTYLEAPQKTVPGTYMAFAGLRNPQDRADVIAYLKTKA
jgi:cytochrome c